MRPEVSKSTQNESKLTNFGSFGIKSGITEQRGREKPLKSVIVSFDINLGNYSFFFRYEGATTPE